MPQTGHGHGRPRNSVSVHAGTAHIHRDSDATCQQYEDNRADWSRRCSTNVKSGVKLQVSNLEHDGRRAAPTASIHNKTSGHHCVCTSARSIRSRKITPSTPHSLNAPRMRILQQYVPRIPRSKQSEWGSRHRVRTIESEGFGWSECSRLNCHHR